jgi:sporulation-control protein
MSFFKKILAGVGIGGVKVDTILAAEVVEAGADCSGVVHIKGGSAEQKIGSIWIDLLTEVRYEDGNYGKIVLEQYLIEENVHVQANENIEISFTIPMPPDLPVTVGGVSVWLKTRVDVSGGVDPSDNDHVQVAPFFLCQQLLDGLNLLGFQLVESECVWAHPQMRTRLPFVQEFEFKASGLFRGRLNELEVIFIPQNDFVDVFFEIDRKASWFEEHYDLDERMVYVQIGADQLDCPPDAVALDLEHLLSQYC